MTELQENTIDQKSTSLVFERDGFIKNKDILICLNVIAIEYGGEVLDKN